MAPTRKQMWLAVLVFVAAAVLVSIAYKHLRAGNIQMAEGRQAYDAGRFKLAEDAYARATKLAPENAEAWYWLGISRKNQGLSVPAADALIQATKLDPTKANWWFESAQALQWAQRFEESEAAWQKLIDLVPADDSRVSQAQINIARCQAARGQVDQAVATIGKMLAERDDPRLRFVLAELLAWAGKYDESAQQYRQALNSVPEK